MSTCYYTLPVTGWYVKSDSTKCSLHILESALDNQERKGEVCVAFTMKLYRVDKVNKDSSLTSGSSSRDLFLACTRLIDCLFNRGCHTLCPYSKMSLIND